ncbi:ADP-ribosyltransferase domain-containing protein [Nocardioides sp. SYSU D00065]|uniref:ADP-ribosyltransferase domain-containing protein n=1 Tax=Nocardioides sp. SYSU D00065 TaxID=2817378 RepID=UPI001B336439|nr:ADP-ribosyltransferase domain-containing protein [Nocardioides sp. SYSU D00065]
MTQTPDLERLLSTLEQLPPHEGVVFRGCEARSHERWPGRTHVTQALLSTSRDPRVATENFSTDAVYAVLSRTGRSIEQFSAARHEREVVFLPGTVLTLVTRVRVRDLGVTVVEEFDPAGGEPEPVDLDAVLEEIGRAVLEAGLRPDVPAPIPGKFAGDIA